MECPFSKRYPSELCRDDSYFMAYAYNEAINAWKEDEVPIGAVICCGGQIIAKAHNRVEALKDATAHAEIQAITQAAAAIGDWRLNECTLYVTKEPCPMCSGASVMSRLQRVVYACPDPKMGLLGGAASIHEIPTLNHRLQVTQGIMEAECRDLLQAYFKLKRINGLTAQGE
ncbi:MAG: nucleoside deaminase [Verrucomicrobia bacterium]|nr:nucleoside deaminase [Verrucomicrobiota bacterium]